MWEMQKYPKKDSIIGLWFYLHVQINYLFFYTSEDLQNLSEADGGLRIDSKPHQATKLSNSTVYLTSAYIKHDQIKFIYNNEIDWIHLRNFHAGTVQVCVGF